MIQAMIQHTVISSGIRAVRLIIVAGGSVYGGDIRGVALVQGGADLIDPAIRPQLAAGQGKVYIVDGSPSIYVVDVNTLALTTYAATAGTTPTDCTLTCVWRDRLVLAAPPDTPQNFFASRSGTHTDWDYAAIGDPAAAYAGNAGEGGRIGDVLTALIPFQDDVLILGGDHSIYKMEGDITDGGSINLVSDAIGIIGPNAWCQDPTGNIYFVGTTGFFRMQADGQMQNLSGDRVNELFRGIDRTANYIECHWDRDKHGCWVFITPHASTVAQHLFYDARADAWIRDEYPVSFGPTAALVYDGDADNDRAVLLGGRDGYIQILDDEALTDDGQAIVSYVYCGPVRPAGDVNNGKLVTMDFVLGERATGDSTTPWNLNYVLQAGSDANNALETPAASAIGTFDEPGNQPRIGQRLAGNSFWLKLWNATTGTYWANDRITGRFQFAGRRR